MDFPPDEKIQPMPWLAVPRKHPIRMIVIHATRGAVSMELQYQATKNWYLSPNNIGAQQNGVPLWGSSSNRIISHEGQMCVAWPEDMQPTWSAGYGYNGPPTDWAIDEYAISIELAQPNNNTYFTEATLKRAAQECAQICQAYEIPAVWLDSVDQTGAVPTGITGHDRTDNGRRLSKSDPGDYFPWEEFMDRVREMVGEPMDDIEVLKARMALLEIRVEYTLAELQYIVRNLSPVGEAAAVGFAGYTSAWQDYNVGRIPRQPADWSGLEG